MTKLKLIEGDTIDYLRQLLKEKQTWDYCLTSPPYFGLIDYGHPGQYGLEESLGAYLDIMQDTFRLVYDGMSERGVMWLNIASTTSGYSTIACGGRRNEKTGRRKPTPGYRSGEEIPVPWLLLDRLSADGWFHRETIIWNKGWSNSQPTGVPARNFEYIFVLGKHKVSRPKLDYEPWCSSVLNWAPKPDPDHPCKMSQALACHLIERATRKTATVIDPFIGTGTTAIAANAKGYSTIGIDLDISIATERTYALQQVLPL